MVKILFIDIDGTLVRGLGKISRKNLLAIKKYVELGGKVVLSTGRSIVSIRKCVEQIKKKTNYVPEYAICSTGGYIYNYLDQTAYINPINNELARKIYEYCKKNHLIMWSYTENSNQKNAVYSNYPLYWWIAKIFKNLNTLLIKPATDLTSFKIIVMSRHKERISQILQWFHQTIPNQINVSVHNKYMLEINSFGINKGYGIKFILNKLNLTPEDAAAIGNGANDIPAFSSVKTSFAVNTNKKNIVKSATFHYNYFNNVISHVINEHILKQNDEKK